MEDLERFLLLFIQKVSRCIKDFITFVTKSKENVLKLFVLLVIKVHGEN